MSERGVLVVTALLWEATPIRACLTDVRCETGEGWRRWDGRSRSGRPTSVLAGGIGANRARQALHAAPPAFDVLISAGCAGALDAALEPGAVIIGDRVLTPGGVSSSCDRGWILSARRAATRAGLSSHEGAVLAASEPLLTRGAKERAQQRFGAIAVEMEAGAVAEEASRRGAALVVVRAILDPATSGLEHVIGCVDALGRPKPAAIARAIARGRLATVLELARLAAGRRACLRALNAVFREIFAEPPTVAD